MWREREQGIGTVNVVAEPLVDDELRVLFMESEPIGCGWRGGFGVDENDDEVWRLSKRAREAEGEKIKN